MSAKQFGIALCAGASLLLAIALNPAISNFVDFAFFKKTASLNEIADCYSDFGIFVAGLIKNLTAPEGIIVAGLSALSFFALFTLLNMGTFSEPKSRTLKDGKLGKQSQITSSRKITKANIVWADEDHGSDPAICIGNIGGKSVFAEATHACAVAPSGSFKTRGSVYQTLDYNTWNGGRNALVMDPSLEVYAQSHNALEKRGYRVRVLDPEMVTDSYNPISSIASLCETGEAARAQERAREVGSILYPATGGENDWVKDDAAGAFAGICYAIAADEAIPIERKNLWSCMATILEGTKGGDAKPLKKWLESNGAQTPQAILSASFRASSDRQESSILSTLLAGIQSFATDSMRQLTSVSTFKIDELLEEKSVVFFRIGGPADERNKFVSLFLASHWAEVSRRGAKRGSLRPVTVLADEAHVLPRFDLSSAVEQGRKYGYSFYMWLQSLSGLDKYKTAKEDGKDAIISNCNVKVIYRAGSVEDAEFFSKLSGESTILSKTQGLSKGDKTSSSSTGFSEQRQPVWSPGDLIHSDPQTQGIHVIKSLPGKPGRSGCFVVEIKDVRKCSTARHFAPAFGTREYEAKFITREIEKLEKMGPHITNLPEAWTPNFNSNENDGEQGNGPEPTDTDVFGI